MYAPDPRRAAAAAGAADQQIPVVITAGFPGRNKDAWHADWPNSATAKWLVNNNSWTDPSVPLYLSKGAYGTAATPGFSTQLVDVALGSVVDLVVVNNGLGSSPEVHPLHLHGYKFWVVGFGALPYPEDAATPARMNLDDPVLVDTFPLQTGYYAVLRFVASNPGVWHFHCHLLFHMMDGLQMALNVAEAHQPRPTRAWYDGQTLDQELCMRR